LMGVLAIGRKSIEAGESYQLREPAIPYGAHFGVEKSNIEPKKRLFVGRYSLISNMLAWSDPKPQETLY